MPLIYFGQYRQLLKWGEKNKISLYLIILCFFLRGQNVLHFRLYRNRFCIKKKHLTTKPKQIVGLILKM